MYQRRVLEGGRVRRLIRNFFVHVSFLTVSQKVVPVPYNPPPIFPGQRILFAQSQCFKANRHTVLPLSPETPHSPRPSPLLPPYNVAFYIFSLHVKRMQYSFFATSISPTHLPYRVLLLRVFLIAHISIINPATP